MTMHTYKVSLSHDTEAVDPRYAAIDFVQFMLEFPSMSVGDERRPMLRVEQFVDTDKHPRVFEVDTLDWTVKELPESGRTLYTVTATDNTGTIGLMNNTRVKKEADDLYRALLVEYIQGNEPDFDPDGMTDYQIQVVYDEWHAEAEDPGKIEYTSQWVGGR